MAYIVMAYIVMAHIVNTVMAFSVMAYIVMAYIIIDTYPHGVERRVSDLPGQLLRPTQAAAAACGEILRSAGPLAAGCAAGYAADSRPRDQPPAVASTGCYICQVIFLNYGVCLCMLTSSPLAQIFSKLGTKMRVSND